MDNEATKQAILGAIRTALVALGGIVATRGWIESANVDLYAGAFVVIIGAAWSIYDKFRTEAAAKTREVAAVNAGIAYSNADPAQTPPVEAPKAQAIIQGASK